MVYKELKTKELYASIPNTDFIKVMFREGLRMGSTQLAISAMEELIVRGDTDYVCDGLTFGFTNGFIKLGTSMCSMIARSLVESCREVDPFLTRYGKALFKGEGGNGPREWIAANDPAKKVDTSIVREELKKYFSEVRGATEAAKESIANIKNMSTT
jgi:hypothetical protein